MGSEKVASTREERLAQRLRENLHRRKAQARAMHTNADESEPPGLPKGRSEG